LISPVTSRDLWLFDLNGGESRPLLETLSNERAPTFSPDGNLIAFVSDEYGRDQVYVREHPDGVKIWKVTSEGGVEPRWSRDGTALFYRSSTHLMMIPVEKQSVLQFGVSQPLFDASEYFRGPVGIATYDTSLDDSQFLLTQVESIGLDQWSVIQNWTALLDTMFSD
jgi:dipeptidyl aminopeptidase/acylaminoacyl peptidase